MSALGTLAWLAACANDPNVQQRASEPGSSWRVDTTPVFDLADEGEAAEPVIGLAVGVARLPNGEVVVADQGRYALRWFTPDGALLRTVGRQGMGPGEFGYLSAMHRCGEAIYVWDLAKVDQRQVFGLDGAVREPLAMNRQPTQVLADARCSVNGDWLHMGYGNNRDLPLGRHRRTAPFWLVTPDGTLRASLGEHPGTEWLVEQDGDGLSLELHPLGRMPVFAVGRDRAYIGSADSFVVRAFAFDGTDAGILRDDRTDPRTQPADEARFKYLDTLGTNDRTREARMRRWDAMEFPPTVPAYDAMLVDAEDLVWIRRFPRRMGALAEWLVFRSDGTRVAVVTLPETLTVHEIGIDYIAGIEVDPVEGRQSVRVYTLRRAE